MSVRTWLHLNFEHFGFSSSNYAVATVDASNGLATGTGTGTAYISAYSGSVTSNSAILTVTSVPPIIAYAHAAFPELWSDRNERRFQVANDCWYRLWRWSHGELRF